MMKYAFESVMNALHLSKNGIIYNNSFFDVLLKNGNACLVTKEKNKDFAMYIDEKYSSCDANDIVNQYGIFVKSDDTYECHTKEGLVKLILEIFESKKKDNDQLDRYNNLMKFINNDIIHKLGLDIEITNIDDKVLISSSESEECPLSIEIRDLVENISIKSTGSETNPRIFTHLKNKDLDIYVLITNTNDDTYAHIIVNSNYSTLNEMTYSIKRKEVLSSNLVTDKEEAENYISMAIDAINRVSIKLTNKESKKLIK